MNKESIAKIWVTADAVWIRTTDGREASELFSNYVRLQKATDEQRGNYRVSHYGIHWPEIDEDLSFDGFFARQLFVAVGDVVDGGEDVFVGVGETDVAARHHTLGDGEEARQRHIYVARSGAFEERSHEVARESGAMNIHPYANDRGSIEHAVDTGLGVVAHDKAAELQAGAQEAVSWIVPELD